MQPTANCTSTSAATSSSAFWVGLGGNSTTSNALEQTGTEVDCLADGTVRYSAWYELVPAGSVKVALKIHAGDRISAAVKVNGTAVTVSLENATTGKSFTKTLRMAAPDISSAEWIAEAPSALTPGGAAVLPLTDFGTVQLHERERHLDRRPHRHDLRLRLDRDEDPARVRVLRPRPRRALRPLHRRRRERRHRHGRDQPRSGGSAFAVTWNQAPEL